MNFTNTQIEAVMTAQNATCTVEEYAAQMGWNVVAEAAPVAPVAKSSKSKRPVGQTAVTVVHSAETGTLLVTTNSGFAGRSAEWVLADWNKTVQNSRKSDVRFAELLAASDVAVYTTGLLDFVTAEDKLAVDRATAIVLADFYANGYACISKVKKTVQAQIEALTVEAATETAEEAETAEKVECTSPVPSHYNAVKGATGTQETGYKYNEKTGKFTKKRAKK